MKGIPHQLKRIVFTLVFFLFFFWLLIPLVVSAGAEHNVSGYAWSSNIGWISFNNTSGGGSANYGVNKDGSGNLVGYAWSSNIGWIQFGGLSGFPSGSGTTAQNAQIVGSSLIGWARALSNGGGWDGWISLTGTGYGVTLSGTNLSGYGWGSDVVGWVDFSLAIIEDLPIDACGTGSGTTPKLTEPTGASACSQGTLNSNSPADITTNGSQAWRWSCGTVTTCSAPKYGCTTATDTNYNPTGPNNTSGCANTCANGANNYPTCTTNNGICINGATNPSACDNGGGGPFTVTASAGSNGSISPFSQSVNSGNTTTFTVTPNGGYTASISGTCPSGTLVGTIYTTGTIIANCTVIASFSLIGIGTDGACSTPQVHYTCSSPTGDTGTERVSSPSRWTWTCPGTTSSDYCSENKSPIIIED